MAEELAGRASLPERSAIAMAPTSPVALAEGAQYRRLWEQAILRAKIPLPSEYTCLLVAASAPKCPGKPLEFAALAAKAGVEHDTARRIARRWLARDSLILSGYPAP